MNFWPKSKPVQPALPSSRLVGVDLNASRISAVTSAAGSAKAIALTTSSNELALYLDLESYPIAVGPLAMARCRRTPHLVCSNFLNQLGVPREWRGPRRSLTPETALLAAFEQLRLGISSVGDRFALTLPEYLSPKQIKATLDLAAKAKLTLTGSASMALAVAAHRADGLLKPATAMPVDKPDWVVPLPAKGAGPGVVIILDADDAALSATAVEVSAGETRLMSSQHWARLSVKLWKDRLLDAIADRCVRLCRRDPRDSADAEQGLFDQLDSALDTSRRGNLVNFTARADRWYQDLQFAPADFEAFTQPLAETALTEIRGMVAALSLPAPPRAVWLTSGAALLPGLATALHEQSAENTEVAVLPAEAAAEAAAALDARLRAGTLPAGHHDAVIPVTPKATGKTFIGKSLTS